MKKSRLQELAGIKIEAQGDNLEYAIKDKSTYREFIDIMDELTDIWYAAGYTKQDIVDYIDGMLPANNSSYNNLREADVKVIPSAAGGDIEMTVTFNNAIRYFEEAAEEMGLSVDLSDASTQQKMAELMRDDLENWLGNNGAQWIEDGMNYDVYNDLDS